MQIEEYDVYLCDDGTMDTVIEVCHERWEAPKEFRYDTVEFAMYLDEFGCLDLKAFAEDIVIPDAKLED